jgi:hypothetical protein
LSEAGAGSPPRLRRCILLRVCSAARAALAIALASSGIACSILGDFDVPLGEGPAADGGTTGPIEGAVLVDSFDEERPACGFGIGEGTATFDTEARTGPGACRLCATVTGRNIRMDRRISDAPPGTYVLEAWFRRLPGAERPSQWALRLSARNAEGEAAVESSKGEVDEVWRQAQATLSVGDDATEIVARLGSESGGLAVGDCLLIDDLVLRRLP